MMHSQLCRISLPVGQRKRCQVKKFKIFRRNTNPNVCPLTSQCIKCRTFNSQSLPSNKSCHAASSSGLGSPAKGLPRIRVGKVLRSYWITLLLAIAEKDLACWFPNLEVHVILTRENIWSMNSRRMILRPKFKVQSEVEEHQENVSNWEEWVMPAIFEACEQGRFFFWWIFR